MFDEEADAALAAQAALETARNQLRIYLADERLARQHPTVPFTGIALVFRGWELVSAEAVDPLGMGEQDEPIA